LTRIIRFSPDPHQETQILLPWYVNGRIDDADRAVVEAHLRDCAACQAELRLERRLDGAVAELPLEVEQSWRAMREKIDDHGRGRWGAAIGDRTASWAVAAQIAAAVVGLALILPRAAISPAPASAPAYHALGAKTPAKTGDIIVVFRPDASAEALADALRRSGARLVDGPTAADAFVLQAAPDGRDATLRTLRADPAVALAQPIDPAGPSP
jgi:anti-sigma factor RsiW